MVTRNTRRISSVIVSAALGASMLLQGASASASSAATVNCKAEFDAYKVSEATRQACGIKTWRLAQRRSLPGGGNEYVYYLNGHKTVYRIPPNGFNPLQATDTDLAKYNLPSRPTGGAQLARWATMMSRIHIVTPPSFLVSLPVSAGYRINWSGYETTATGMWEAWSEWNEVSIGSSCSGSTEFTWTGLGGDLTLGSHFLAQIGTETGVNGITPHNAWWEVVPDYGGIVPISGLVAHAGYQFDAEVEWLSTHYYYFYAYDSYTGNFASFSYGTYSYDGIGADFIMERGQTGPSSWTPLSNYYYLNFVDDEVNGRGNGHYLNQYSNAALTMTSDGTSGGRQLSYVSQAVSGTGAFQTHYGPYCS
jgi:Peptidase A4 family